MFPKHTDPKYRIGQIVLTKNSVRPHVIMGLRRTTGPADDMGYQDTGWEYDAHYWGEAKYDPMGIELKQWGWVDEHEIGQTHERYDQYIPNKMPHDGPSYDKLEEERRHWLLVLVFTENVDMFRMLETKFETPYKLSKKPFLELPIMFRHALVRVFHVLPLAITPVESRNTLFTPPAKLLTFDQAGGVNLRHLNIRLRTRFNHDFSGVKKGDVVTLTYRSGPDDSHHELHYVTDDHGSSFAPNWYFDAVEAEVPATV